MNFVKRTTVPNKDNKYYNSNNNPFVSAGYGMFQNNGNCTCYSWGRAYELLGSKPKLYTGNAETWYKHTEDGYKRGKTPKLGAIVCWEGVGSKAGHVANVEGYTSDGSIVTSNSAWKNGLFYTKTLKPPYNMGNGYIFQGFIYLPLEFDDNIPKQDWVVGQYKLLVSKAIRTRHDLGDNVVRVGRCMSSVRPNLTSSNPNDEAKYKVGTTVNITEIYIDNENRVWGKLQNCWIVLCNRDGTPQSVKI